MEINLNGIEAELKDVFFNITETENKNQEKVIKAFRDNRIEARHFYPSTGYGYSDSSRDKLDAIFADIFSCEAAFVRPHFCSATHAITLALRALLKPNDLILSISGRPYDTIATSIGLGDEKVNTFIDRGVKYKEIALEESGKFNKEKIGNALDESHIKVVFIQRSRGYEWRKAISCQEIEDIATFIHEKSPETVVFIDNCYGEFTQDIEPTDVGADVLAGSLIKNPGGGFAPTGGYIAGREEYINIIKDFFTSPGTGQEIGSYEGNYRPFYQGLFMAPHVVAEALKGATMFSAVYEKLGYEVMPKSDSKRFDITQSIKLDKSEEVINFCQSIQQSSPVEAHVVPEPWDMPGYSDKVIMAAGTFVQGASIELSADAPIREPYIVYMQGGLTYQHCKIALKMTLESIGIKVV